ncbi:MAG: DUF971 domain-containing protein [Thiotrichaceae bacterium]
MTLTSTPTGMEFRQKSRLLSLTFDDGKHFEFSYEFLRVYSPSAEVRGHGVGQETLQVGKADVSIEKVSPIGSYAVQLHFDDGHDTGIYSWEWLHYLGENQAQLWQDYLDELEKAGQKRAPSH